MNWYIGQPIVAIKNSKCGKIKKGDEFIIHGLQTMCKCTPIGIDVNIKYFGKNKKYKCTKCGNTFYLNNKLWKNSNLFAPLDVDISELTNILSEPSKINQ